MKTNMCCSRFSLVLVSFIFLTLAGCTPIISKQIRDQVSEEMTLRLVAENPEAYTGKMVLWSGVIISAENLKEGTMIEVLQKPACFRGEPKDVDDSEGRFLALYLSYLDVAIYTQGRKVTVAGQVQGKKVRSLGEIEYTYPLISVKEIHLWPVERKETYYYYPYPYWDDLWWPYPCPHPRRW